jgi:hypothetical protein
MEKDEISIFFHLIRHSFVMTPSPQGEGFEFAFFKNQSKIIGEDIILPKRIIKFPPSQTHFSKK